MKKLFNPPHPTPTARTILFFLVFVFTAVLFELTRIPLVSTGTSIVLFGAFTSLSMLFGGIYLAEPTILSRTTSASAAFLLSLIASRLSLFPACSLLLAVVISYIGAKSISYQTPRTPGLAIIYSIIIVLSTILIATVLVLATTIAYHAIYH